MLDHKLRASAPALFAKRPKLRLRVSASVRIMEGQVEQKVLSGCLLVEERPRELQNPRDVPPDLVDRVVLLGLRKIEGECKFWADVLLSDDAYLTL